MKNNVYIVLHTLSTGGAERHASSIANYLSKNDYDVTILLLDNNIVKYELADKVKVYAISDICDPEYTKTSQLKLSSRILLKITGMLSKKKYNNYNRYLYYKINYVNKLACFFEKQKIEKSDIVISFLPSII